VAFFLDESQINKPPLNPTMVPVDLLEGRKGFDMRDLHSYSLIEPEYKVTPERFAAKKESTSKVTK